VFDYAIIVVLVYLCAIMPTLTSTKKYDFSDVGKTITISWSCSAFFGAILVGHRIPVPWGGRIELRGVMVGHSPDFLDHGGIYVS
jgi:hypothetical protein